MEHYDHAEAASLQRIKTLEVETQALREKPIAFYRSELGFRFLTLPEAEERLAYLQEMYAKFSETMVEMTKASHFYGHDYILKLKRSCISLAATAGEINIAKKEIVCATKLADIQDMDVEIAILRQQQAMGWPKDAEEVPETSLRDVSYDDSDDLTPRAELAIAVKMAEEMEAAEAGAK